MIIGGCDALAPRRGGLRGIGAGCSVPYAHDVSSLPANLVSHDFPYPARRVIRRRPPELRLPPGRRIPASAAVLTRPPEPTGHPRGAGPAAPYCPRRWPAVAHRRDGVGQSSPSAPSGSATWLARDARPIAAAPVVSARRQVPTAAGGGLTDRLGVAHPETTRVSPMIPSRSAARWCDCR